MSLIKYHNLLMFQRSATELDVIGEDTNITDFSSNAAEVGMTVTEQSQYLDLLANITTLRVLHLTLSTLPPGAAFTGLTALELNNCAQIMQVPTTYPSTLEALKVASTKVSSIPSVYANLKLLDVSNCKRISSIGATSLETIIMSHSAVTEITDLQNLLRLVALNTKITTVPLAPNLAVIMWSGVANSQLTVHTGNTSLIHILTSGPDANITSTNGVVTSILL
jgi:hypothetical protein